MPTTFTVGRDASADLVIGDPSISRRHAEIVLLDDARLFVRDLGAANGTVLVRGGAHTRLAREVISRGDEVQFGDVTLTFDALRDMLFEKLGRAPAAPAAAAAATDDAAARAPGPAGGAADVREVRGALGVRVPPRDADRSRRPGLGDFVPVGGLHLLRSRGLLLPAALFALLIFRLMWLLNEPTGESLASFVVEFSAALAVMGFVVVYQLCGKRKPLKVILAVMVAEIAIMSLHDTLSKPFCDPTGAKTIIMREMVAEGSIKIPIKRPPSKGGAPPRDQGAPEPRREHLHSSAASMALTEAQPGVGFYAGEDGFIKAVKPGFFSLWYAFFFCAGLIEELEKMLPVLGLIWLTTASRRQDVKQWGVSEPLDAIVYAAAAALTFILFETLFGNGYVGGQLQDAREAGRLIIGALQSFPLAILRTVKGMAGHIAYSGYFAYFVGLGVMRPRHRERYWLGGWIGASLIHGLFNAASGAFSSIVSVLAFFFLLAVILKARQISPARDENFATRAVPRAKAI
jgi:RsiW-degrading membrane proteinase PrsW (M82 family)